MEIIARGREAVISDAGPGLVLRQYLDARDTTAEVVLHRHVASHGYPVPRMERQQPGGMVLERVEGPTLLEALISGTTTMQAGADLLADLHQRLHRVPPPPGTPPGHRVVHRDLHPANVLLGTNGPVVVDWASGSTGHPDLDIGNTALVLAEVVVAGVAAEAGDVAAMGVPVDLVRALLVAFLVADHGGDVTARLDEVVTWRIAVGMPPAGLRGAAELIRELVGSRAGA